MQQLIFTLDYEIHGNGDGHPVELMTEPTYRLMDLLETYGAKLVIFADVAEILQFKAYYEEKGQDDYAYQQIIQQLQAALHRGHDVQLHIHSSYFGSHFAGGKWHQNWKNYNLAGLAYNEIYAIVNTCKNFLEDTLKPIKPDYECYIFRAANWSMHPTENIAKALKENGIYIDSSVYKYGKQKGWVNYDYMNAYDPTFPYYASNEDICEYDPKGALLEFPIHCELKPITAFIAPIRIFRALRALRHKHDRSYPSGEKTTTKKSGGIKGKIAKYFSILTSLHPRKLDFNQLTARQMIQTLKKIDNKQSSNNYITLIGHSKSFIKYNEKTLRGFLKYVQKHKDQYRFSLYPKKSALVLKNNNSLSLHV